MDLIRSLIDRVEVWPGEKHGTCNVELTGALAGILTFIQKQKTAASIGDDGTNLMVAGTGLNEAPTITKHV